MPELSQLMAEIVAFRQARGWQQFHSPRNLSASVLIEAAELLEIFQWAKDEELKAIVETRREDISDEMADVLIYLLTLAHDIDIDPVEAVRSKLVKNGKRYPAP